MATLANQLPVIRQMQPLSSIPAPAVAPIGGSLATALAANRQPSNMLPPPSMAPLDTAALPALPGPALPNVVAPPPSRLMLDTAKRDQMATSGSGIQQIKNPILRGLATAADITGSVFAPRLDYMIPGTQGHHELLMHQQNALIDQDQAQQASDMAQQNAEVELRQRRAGATLDEARVAALGQPAAPEYDYVDGPSGKVAIQKGTTTGVPVTVNGQPLEAKPAVQTPEEQAFDDRRQQGMSASQAFASVQQDKNVKDSSLQQQFLDGYRRAHPEASEEDAIKATIRATRIDPQVQVINAGAAARQSAGALGPVTGTGDSAIANMPSSMQQLIRSTAAGDIAIPPAGSRAQGAQALRQAVLAYDPTYTDARYKGKQQFKTGGDADRLVSLTTTLSHAQSALQHSQELGFAPGLPFNASAADSTYTKDAQFVTGELGKLVEGKALTQGEHDELIKGLNSTRQNIRDAALNESLQLLGGKVEGVFQKYKNATGEELPADKFLDADTQTRLQQLHLRNSAAVGNGSDLSVTAPDGSVHTFPDQTSAYKFKKLINGGR